MMMDVQELSSEILAHLLLDGIKDLSKKPVLLLGAGASIPSLPSAFDLKVQIASSALKQAYFSSSSMTQQQQQQRQPHGAETILAKNKAHSSSSVVDLEEEKEQEIKVELEKAVNVIKEKCSQDHLTLEVLVSLISYRSRDKLDTDSMWQALCRDCGVNEFSHTIALLVKFGCIHRILTSNFDHILEDACQNVGAEYQVVSNVQLEKANDLSDILRSSAVTQICPFHGTTYRNPNKSAGEEEEYYTGPFTATATGLAKPFSRRMAEYMMDSLKNKERRPIIVFGYSGSDHFDLNPLLSSLNLGDEENRSHWYWVIHSGNQKFCSQAVKNIFGARSTERLLQSNAFYGADTPSVLQDAVHRVVGHLGLHNSASIVPFQKCPLQSTYEERLETWFRESFSWNRDEARSMILDLENNLPAAWIVSEHYRLIQLGYDEEYSFRFAGIFDVNTDSRSMGVHPHLALKFAHDDSNTEVVEFGYILEAARIYRIEMNDPDQLFSVTKEAMNRFIQQAEKIVRVAPRKNTEVAALHLGLAIAYDYLGLISGRHVTQCLKEIKKLKTNINDLSPNQVSLEEEIQRLEKVLEAKREEACNGFAKCISYATLAKNEMASELDKLIPAIVWIQVGLDNMGRFKVPGSDDALDWLTKAIKGRKALIEYDIQVSIDHGETDIMTSKVVSVDMHYPPLWRRGGELVQQVLETQGFNSAPKKLLSDLSEDRKQLLYFGFDTSENAFKRYQEMSTTPNLNFPAVFDVRVLMALANRDVLLAQKEVENCRAVFQWLSKDFSTSKIKSTASWIQNIEGRIEDFLFQNPKYRVVTDKTREILTNEGLALNLIAHFQSMGLTDVQAFHFMDTNKDKRISAKEISVALNTAGLNIDEEAAYNMIKSDVMPGGQMDVVRYIRFINRYK